jgi:hypothetical protein
MSKMADIQRKIDEAMESIANIKRAEPAPFFYTRLDARLRREETNFWERLNGVVTRPVFALTTIMLVLVMNIFVAVNEAPLNLDVPSDGTEMATADDLGTNSFYDIENVQP